MGHELQGLADDFGADGDEQVSGVAQIALAALAAALEQHARPIPSAPPELDGIEAISINQWRTTFSSEYATAADGTQRGGEAVRKAFQRARDSLESSGRVGFNESYVWAPIRDAEPSEVLSGRELKPVASNSDAVEFEQRVREVSSVMSEPSEEGKPAASMRAGEGEEQTMSESSAALAQALIKIGTKEGAITFMPEVLFGRAQQMCPTSRETWTKDIQAFLATVQRDDVMAVARSRDVAVWLHQAERRFRIVHLAEPEGGLVADGVVRQADVGTRCAYCRIQDQGDADMQEIDGRLVHDACAETWRVWVERAREYRSAAVSAEDYTDLIFGVAYLAELGPWKGSGSSLFHRVTPNLPNPDGPGAWRSDENRFLAKLRIVQPRLINEFGVAVWQSDLDREYRLVDVSPPGSAMGADALAFVSARSKPGPVCRFCGLDESNGKQELAQDRNVGAWFHSPCRRAWTAWDGLARAYRRTNHIATIRGARE